jgi:outer membrane biosynthesis protein TonB
VVETFPRKNYEQLWAALHARVAAIVEGGTYQKPDAANETTARQEERRPKPKPKPKAKPATKRGRGRPKKKTKDDDEESMEVEDEEDEEVEEDEEDEEAEDTQAGKRSKKGTHHSKSFWLALKLVSRVRVHCGSYEHG